MKHFESTLPQGYVEAKTIDANTKKVGLIFTLISAIPMILSVLMAWLALDLGTTDLADKLFANYPVWHPVLFVVALFAYVVCHELVHGVVYKAFTKQKLTFGLTLTVAYCGVPNIYVYRKAALCAVLAPFVVFLPVFALLPFVMQHNFDVLFAAYLLGMHVGGCVGDLYCTGLYLFKFRNPTTLMRDTGPKQTFYVLATPASTEDNCQIATDQTETNN